MPYLDIQGRICGFMNFEQDVESGRFFRRYFVISEEDGSILCYMDNPMNLPEAARRPVLEIQLTSISNARVAAKQRSKVEYCFVVTTPARDYYFEADNHQDMEDWVNRINNASKITVPTAMATPGTLPLDKNGGDKGAISYKTEVVGGVVIRTPVQPGQPSSETDSDEEPGSGRGSGPRSPNHSGGSLDQAQPPLFPGRNVLHSGWCVKQGGVRKNWKRRYFILDDQGISYYKSDQDKISLRTIPIKEIQSCKVADHGPSILRDNLFEIVSAGRTFYVQAYSPEDMNLWIQSVSLALKKKGHEMSYASLLLSRAQEEYDEVEDDEVF